MIYLSIEWKSVCYWLSSSFHHFETKLCMLLIILRAWKTAYRWLYYFYVLTVCVFFLRFDFSVASIYSYSMLWALDQRFWTFFQTKTEWMLSWNECKQKVKHHSVQMTINWLFNCLNVYKHVYLSSFFNEINSHSMQRICILYKQWIYFRQKSPIFQQCYSMGLGLNLVFVFACWQITLHLRLFSLLSRQSGNQNFQFVFLGTWTAV